MRKTKFINWTSNTEPRALFPPLFTFSHHSHHSYQHLFTSHPQQWNKIPPLPLAQCVLTPLPRYFYQWQTCFSVKMQHWILKVSRLPWHFLPFTLSLPSLCSALPFSSKPLTHSPAHHHLLHWPGKVDYREKMSWTLWRGSIRCQLYMCHCAANSDSLFVRPLQATWPRLTHFLRSMLSLFRSDICLFIALPHAYILTLKHMHTYIHHPTWVPKAWRFPQLNPKYSDRLGSSMVAAVRG